MQRTPYLASVVGAVLALGASFNAAGEAVAVEGRTRSVAVRYDDLELSNRSAIERLYARLEGAAERVCGDYDPRNLRALADWKACYDAALSDAVARAPHAAVAERHRSERERRGTRPVG
jgi:UrcA family protein